MHRYSLGLMSLLRSTAGNLQGGNKWATDTSSGVSFIAHWLPCLEPGRNVSIINQRTSTCHPLTYLPRQTEDITLARSGLPSPFLKSGVHLLRDATPSLYFLEHRLLA